MKTYLWLLPTVSFYCADKVLTLRKGRTLVRIPKIGDQVLKVLKKLDGNHLQDNLVSDPFFCILESLLREKGWLVSLRNPIKYYEEQRNVYTRQLSYYAHIVTDFPDLVFERLQNSSVAVLGMGGIGSIVAHNLAGAGVGKMTFVDFDLIENSNFNRQILYSPGDLGCYKSEVSARVIKEKFPDIEVNYAIANMNERPPNIECDLIIVAGECDELYDNPSWIGDRPVIRAGYDGEQGNIGPLFCKETGGPSWQEKIEADGQRTILKDFFAGEKRLDYSWNSSGSTINTVVSGLLAEECLRYLVPALGPVQTKGKVLRIDMVTLKTFTVDVAV